jgi:hypothetical protein
MCFACYLPQPLDLDYKDRVDPDIIRHWGEATTSESTPPAHAARVKRLAPYIYGAGGFTLVQQVQ